MGSLYRAAAAVTVLLSLLPTPAPADTVAFASTTPEGQKTPAPLYQELTSGWSQQGIHSTVSPGSGSRTITLQTARFSITPSLGAAGGVYTFDITHGTAGTMTADITLGITVSGGELVDDQGHVITTATFRKGGDHSWERVGVLRLNPGITTPTLTFSVSGSYTNRLFVDGFRFDQAPQPPCHLPFADADGDHDVDQADLGAFQACYAGVGLIPDGYCLCFDREPTGGDHDVDPDDLEAFMKCMTGPAIPWSEQTSPGC